MKEKVFVDYTVSGRKKPWNLKKKQNLLYANYLEILEYNKARNVKECGDIIGLRKDDEGHLKVNQTWFCHSRLCPMCNWRRSLVQSYELQLIIKKAIKKYPNACLLFLTLTEKNCSGIELGELLKKMTLGFMRMSQYKKVSKNLLGYIRSTEITINENSKEYHPHMHIILFMRSTYFSGKANYISKTEWTKLYRKARKLEYDPIIDIRIIKKKGTKDETLAASQEVAKYQVKDSSFITGNINRDLKVVDDLESALRFTKRISYGGVFKEINKKMKQSKESDNDSKKDTMLVVWNKNKKKYYISRCK